MATAGIFPKQTGDKIYHQDIEKLRRIPQVTSGAYTLNVLHVGQHVVANGTITVPWAGSGIQAGDAITVYNPGTVTLTIALGDGLPATIYKIAGTTTTPTGLAGNGIATFLCVDAGLSYVSPAKFVVIGGGLI